MYEAKVLADSLSPDGVRLVTLEVEYPHAIHKDIMTHRMFSRNFQSFRAFPPEKVIERIKADPFTPDAFRSRVKGMGEGAAVADQEEALEIWMGHVNGSLVTAESMIQKNFAKAQVNFVLQDLTSIRGIITATEWDNFWNLRLAKGDDGSPLARPEVYRIASMMFDAFSESEPRRLEYGEWHIPLTDPAASSSDQSEFGWDRLKKLSTARCARVSYLTHDGQRDSRRDMELHDSLASDGHMSPFEHVATPIKITGPKYLREVDWTTRKETGKLTPGIDWRANFFGWRQYRLDIEGQLPH